MTTSTAPLIQVKSLYKRYGTKSVLKGVDLAIAEGSVVALLGTNGAGKSTLLRLISGLAKPDRGDISLSGVGLKKAGAALRRYVGLVSHAPLLYDHLTACENLQFFAGMYDLNEPEGRIETVLQVVDLWSRRNDQVRTYSRGMQQRLAIARAILHDPPILLLDEPDTGLDQKSSQMLQTLIQHLGDKRRAILFSTHNLDRALTWSDSVALLVRGRIDQYTAASLFDNAELIHQLHVAIGVE
ncbi:MAG: heme ABC exporter ATP-binding protein CcmA [Caldilineaceae bacterium]|nr:heme ABC exporter ATP-binding protein CcmA [Caldilineaceae bacterium]